MSIVRKLSAVATIFLSLFLTIFSTGGLANSYTKGQHIECSGPKKERSRVRRGNI